MYIYNVWVDINFFVLYIYQISLYSNVKSIAESFVFPFFNNFCLLLSSLLSSSRRRLTDELIDELEDELDDALDDVRCFRNIPMSFLVT